MKKIYFLEFEIAGSKFCSQKNEFVQFYYSLEELVEVADKAFNFYRGTVDVHLMYMELRPNPGQLFHRLGTYYASDWSNVTYS